MKHLFLFVAVAATTLVGCGDLAQQVGQNITTSNELRTLFDAKNVEVTSDLTNGKNKLEITITNAQLGQSFNIVEERLAPAIAIEANRRQTKQAEAINVKLSDGKNTTTFEYTADLLDNYDRSAKQGKAYVDALVKQDKTALSNLADPDYLGQSSMPDVLTFAQLLTDAGQPTSIHLAGVLDSNIENTTIPVHIISYLLKYEGKTAKLCNMFIHIDGDHKVAGFNIQ